MVEFPFTLSSSSKSLDLKDCGRKYLISWWDVHMLVV